MNEILKSEQKRRGLDLFIFWSGITVSICLQLLGVVTGNFFSFLAGIFVLVATMVFTTSNHIIRMLELDHSVIIKQNELLDARLQMIQALLTNNISRIAEQIKKQKERKN